MAVTTKIHVQFRPPSNVSPERYTSLWTESKAAGKLLQSTREELLAYGHQLMKQAVEDHFLEHGLDLESLSDDLLERPRVLHVKLQFGDMQHISIMRNQQLGDVIEEQDGGRYTLIFTVQGAEGLLPHPSIQTLASDNAMIGIIPRADADSARQAAADEQPDAQRNRPLMMTGVDDPGHRSPAGTHNEEQQQSVPLPPLGPPMLTPQQPPRQEPKNQESSAPHKDVSPMAAAECSTEMRSTTSEGPCSGQRVSSTIAEFRPGNKNSTTHGTGPRLSSTSTELSPGSSEAPVPTAHHVQTEPRLSSTATEFSLMGSNLEAPNAHGPTKPQLSSNAKKFTPMGSSIEAPAPSAHGGPAEPRLSFEVTEFSPWSSEAPNAHGPTGRRLSSTSTEFNPGSSIEEPTHAHGPAEPQLSSNYATEFNPGSSEAPTPPAHGPTGAQLSSTISTTQFSLGSSDAPTTTVHGPTKPPLPSTATTEFNPGSSIEPPTPFAHGPTEPRLSSTGTEFKPGSSEAPAPIAHGPTRSRLSSTATEFNPGSSEAPNAQGLTRPRLSSTATEFNPGSSEAPNAQGPTRPRLSWTAKEFKPGSSEAPAPIAHGPIRPWLSSTATEFKPGSSEAPNAHDTTGPQLSWTTTKFSPGSSIEAPAPTANGGPTGRRLSSATAEFMPAKPPSLASANATGADPSPATGVTSHGGNSNGCRRPLTDAGSSSHQNVQQPRVGPSAALPVTIAPRTRAPESNAKLHTPPGRRGAHKAFGGVDLSLGQPRQARRSPAVRPPAQPKKQPDLEVFKYTEQIVELVWGDEAMMGQAVCIAGHTGCGKSTGLPVVLMRELQRRGQKGRVVVTQPRRLAATKLAHRVADTLGEPLGQNVAYAIGQDVSDGYDSSAILFVTTGWLQVKLLHDPSWLNSFTHIIMDEAHERTVDLDMLALLIKRNRRSCEPISRGVSPTVIVMSATMEAGVFANYFGGEAAGERVPEPLIVGGRRFPVLDLTLDDLMSQETGNITRMVAMGLADVLGCPRVIVEAAAAICGAMNNKMYARLFDMLGPKGAIFAVVAAEALKVVHKFMEMSLPLPKPEVTEHLANLGAQLSIKAGMCGAATLIFVPGMHEIGQLRSALQARAQMLGVADRMHLCILHSVVPPEEQDLAMELPPQGCFKVVLATNIAESSITIPDVSVVIDYCLQRVNSYDMVRETEVLQLEWTSLASQKQRSGRAGRVAPGVVFRMVTSRCRASHQEYDLPAILRESLAGTVLSLESKMRRLGKAADLLKEAPQPPQPEQVVYALDYLYKTGALLVEDDSITAMGRLAARLPTSVPLSRLIHLALTAKRCELAAVVVAAGMALRTPPFAMPQRQLLDSSKAYVRDMQLAQGEREGFEGGCYCEPLMLTACFEKWMRSDKTAKWAKTNGVNIRRMKEFEAGVVELCLKLDDAIDHAGIVVRDECRRQMHALSLIVSNGSPPAGSPGSGRFRGEDRQAPSKRLVAEPSEVLLKMHNDRMVMWCLLGLAFAPNMMAGIPQRSNFSWVTQVNGTGLDATRTLRLRGGKKGPNVFLPEELQNEETLLETIENMTGAGTVTRCLTNGGCVALVEFRADESSMDEGDERQNHVPRQDLPRAAKRLLAIGDTFIQGKDEYTARAMFIGPDGAENTVQRVDWKLPIAWHRVTAGGQGSPQRVMPDIRGPMAAMGGDACGCGNGLTADLVAVTHQLTALGRSANEVLRSSSTILLPCQGGLASILLLACLPVTCQQDQAPSMAIRTAEGEPCAVGLNHKNGLSIQLFPLNKARLKAAEDIRGAMINALRDGRTGNLGEVLDRILSLVATPSPGHHPHASSDTELVPVTWSHNMAISCKVDPLVPVVLADTLHAATSARAQTESARQLAAEKAKVEEAKRRTSTALSQSLETERARQLAAESARAQASQSRPDGCRLC